MLCQAGGSNSGGGSAEQIKETTGFLLDVGQNWGATVMIVVLCIIVVGGLMALYIWKGMPLKANKKANLIDKANKKVIDEYQAQINATLSELRTSVRVSIITVQDKITIFEERIKGIDNRYASHGDQLTELLTTIRSYREVINSIKEDITILDRKLFDMLNK